MLNELYALSGALSGMGIDAPDWHREYKELPKVTKQSPCFRIWLTEHGNIADIEEIDKDLASTLRKYGNNQATFPAFNIAPLYRITAKEHINALDSIIRNNVLFDYDKIKSWCIVDNWHDKLIKKVDRCLSLASNKLLPLIKAQNACEQNPITELIQCIKIFSESSDEGKSSFRTALECCVFENLQRRYNLETYLRVLFYKGNHAKNPHDDCGTLSVILDLAERKKYGIPVANERTTHLINDILLKADKADTSSATPGYIKDAYGAAYTDVNEPMPQVKISGFEITLRSMFNEQYCQYRYGKIDDESFPITKAHRADVKKALGWIAQAKNKGITWQHADKDEVIFAYPSSFPEVLPKLAAVFAVSQGDDTQTKARFEQLAEDVIKTLQGILPEDTPDNIRVFAVRKMDKARSKVIFNRNYSAEWFIKSAGEWQKGCKNIPKLDLYASIQNKNNTESVKNTEVKRFNPLIPFPLQVPRIINNVWKQDGTPAQGKVLIKRMYYYQGIELLLDSENEKLLRYYLHILLSHSSGLIQYMGNQQHGGRASSYNQAKEVCFVMSVLGLILYKCHYQMEEYMESIAYLLGQTLKISDELHILYCKIVRYGDMPQQLVGNVLFVTATETPIQAIKQLGRRMKPYISWARCYRVKGKMYREQVEDYLLLYEDIMNKMNHILVNEIHFDDFAKAQVFIGYLAALPKCKNSEVNAANTQKTV
jgi:hypothetical protein